MFESEPGIERPVSSTLLIILTICYALNILKLLAIIIACLIKYLTLPTNIGNKDQIALAIIFDVAIIACTVVYILTVKMKSITLLIANWFLVVFCVISRMILI
jgi:hypothetical protein